MARGVRAELVVADYELGRFIRYQHAEASRLGYPKCSTFAKDIARGTVAPAHTPDDSAMDAVGAWFWALPELRRRICADRYTGIGTEKERARRHSMTLHQHRREIDRLLLTLTGYLQAAVPATARKAA